MSFRMDSTPLHTLLGIKPGEVTSRMLTFNEMRAVLSMVSRDDALVHAVEQRRYHEGLSGEDVYTILAFYMMLQKENFANLYLSACDRTLSGKFLFPDKLCAPTKDAKFD